MICFQDRLVFPQFLSGEDVLIVWMNKKLRNEGFNSLLCPGVTPGVDNCAEALCFTIQWEAAAACGMLNASALGDAERLCREAAASPR